MRRRTRALVVTPIVLALALLLVSSVRRETALPAAATAAQVRDYLAARPLAGEAYRRLAEVEGAHRDDEALAPLYAIAARREPRDRLSHAWLADFYALRGDTARALAHLDQLLRLIPRRAHQLFPTLGGLLMNRPSRTELVAFLARSRPPWRDGFLRWLANQPGLGPMLHEVFEPLREAQVPLSDRERDYWIERLIRDGRVQEAHFLWVDALPPERQSSFGNLHDGSFERSGEKGGVFDWQFLPVAGAAISRSPGPGVVGELALRIDFQDQRVPFAHVQQQLALTAGRYELQGQVRSEDLRNERGLQWRVLCGREQIAASSAFRGSSEWREFQLEFAIPASDCPGQTLQLWLDARIRPEQLIGGRIWFDALRIRRLD